MKRRGFLSLLPGALVAPLITKGGDKENLDLPNETLSPYDRAPHRCDDGFVIHKCDMKSFRKGDMTGIRIRIKGEGDPYRAAIVFTDQQDPRIWADRMHVFAEAIDRFMKGHRG